MRAVDLLLPCAAEQNQHQLRRRQRVRTGVMALAHLQLEMRDPVIQPRFADVGIRAQQRGDVGHVQERVVQAIAQAVLERRVTRPRGQGWACPLSPPRGSQELWGWKPRASYTPKSEASESLSFSHVSVSQMGPWEQDNSHLGRHLPCRAER